MSVYVFGEPGDNLVKIGVSGCPRARAENLRPQLPRGEMLYEQPGGYALERRTHAILAAHRIEGEWFLVTLEQAIAAIREAETNPDTCAIDPVHSETMKAVWAARRERYGPSGFRKRLVTAGVAA